jgi:hypothetical protein
MRHLLVLALLAAPLNAAEGELPRADGYRGIWYMNQPTKDEFECNLYFTNQNGDHTWRLPTEMTGETAKPEVAW